MRRGASVVHLHDPKQPYWDGRGRCPTCRRRPAAMGWREAVGATIKWAAIVSAVVWLAMLGTALWAIWQVEAGRRPFHTFVAVLALWLAWRGAALVWALVEGWRPWRQHAFVEHADRSGEDRA